MIFSSSVFLTWMIFQVLYVCKQSMPAKSSISVAQRKVPPVTEVTLYDKRATRPEIIEIEGYEKKIAEHRSILTKLFRFFLDDGLRAYVQRYMSAHSTEGRVEQHQTVLAKTKLFIVQREAKRLKNEIVAHIDSPVGAFLSSQRISQQFSITDMAANAGNWVKGLWGSEGAETGITVPEQANKALAVNASYESNHPIRQDLRLLETPQDYPYPIAKEHQRSPRTPILLASADQNQTLVTPKNQMALQILVGKSVFDDEIDGPVETYDWRDLLLSRKERVMKFFHIKSIPFSDYKFDLLFSDNALVNYFKGDGEISQYFYSNTLRVVEGNGLMVTNYKYGEDGELQLQNYSYHFNLGPSNSYLKYNALSELQEYGVVGKWLAQVSTKHAYFPVTEHVQHSILLVGSPYFTSLETTVSRQLQPEKINQNKITLKYVLNY